MGYAVNHGRVRDTKNAWYYALGHETLPWHHCCTDPTGQPAVSICEHNLSFQNKIVVAHGVEQVNVCSDNLI